jgi:hypothetical protein
VQGRARAVSWQPVRGVHAVQAERARRTVRLHRLCLGHEEQAHAGLHNGMCFYNDWSAPMPASDRLKHCACGCRDDTDTDRKAVAEAVKRSLDPAEEADVAAEAGAMLVSRSWLRQWKGKACAVGHLLDGRVSPTQSIACVHGGLLPEHPKRCAARLPLLALVTDVLTCKRRASRCTQALATLSHRRACAATAPGIREG